MLSINRCLQYSELTCKGLPAALGSVGVMSYVCVNAYKLHEHVVEHRVQPHKPTRSIAVLPQPPFNPRGIRVAQGCNPTFAFIDGHHLRWIVHSSMK